MKQTKACPKCGCTKLLRVEDVGGDASINLVLGWFGAVPVTRYVCTECGYVESWVDRQYMFGIRERYEKEQRKK